MQTSNNIKEIIDSLIAEKIEYYAIFKPDSGEVVGIYPSHSAKDIENKILVDNDFAEQIFSGSISMHRCFVDETNGNLELIISQPADICNLLYRIIEKKYVNYEPDLCIKINKPTQTISFEISNNIRQRKIKRIFDLNYCEFFLTEYNNPYNFYQTIKFHPSDLRNNNLTFTYNFLPEKFSIFTYKIFDRYAMEIQ